MYKITINHNTIEVNEEEILYLAQKVYESRLRTVTSEAITSPAEMKPYLDTMLKCRDKERFVVVFLNNQHELITSKIMSEGTHDAASIYTREIVKEALALNSSCVILAHNHPSNSANPSQADRAITTRLKSALELIDVRVLDHFIVTDNEIVSFAEMGII